MLSVGLLHSCKDSGISGGTPNGEEGEVRLGVSTDSLYFGIRSESATKAEPTLSSSDFGVRLENTKGEVLKSWESYNDVPEVLKMVFGSYKMVATYGDYSLLPAFGVPVYGAESKFAISQEAPTKVIELNCRPLATKVSIEFASDFGNSYSSYSVEIKTIEKELAFSSEDVNKEAYFKPGELRLKFNIVRKSEPGKVYNYYFSTGVKTKAAEYYRLTLQTLSSNGLLGVSITTDNTTKDVVLENEIPEIWLPRPAPIVYAHNMGESKEVVTTEAAKVEAEATFKTYAGVKKFVVKTTSESLLANGYPTEGIDIMRGGDADYAATIKILKDLGVAWSAVLNNKEEALLLTQTHPVALYLSDLTMNLDGDDAVAADHGFSVEITDKFDQVNEPFAFNIKVNPLVFEVEPMTEGNVWAKHAYIKWNHNIDRAGYIEPQVSSDNGTTWVKADAEIVSDQDGVALCKIKGLNPTSQYKFRVVLGRHIKGTSATYTTEQVSQVQNASFEDWQMDYFKKGLGDRIATYVPWKSGEGQYWNTGNERGYAYGVISNQYTHASATMYTYTARTGTKAAEIRTVGSMTSGSPINSSGKNYEVHQSRGRLLIGSYAYAGSQKDNITYGRGFNERPSTMKFWYQYKPYGEDEFMAMIKVWNQTGPAKTELGSAEFKVRLNSALNTYTEAVVPIVYTNVLMKATHITIEFISTTDAQPRAATKIKAYFPDIYDYNNWYGHIGSILLVDDVELVY